MRRVEIRDAINTTTSLVNHELPMPIFPCRLNNPQVPIGPVVIARVISRTRSPSRSTRMREPSFGPCQTCHSRGMRNPSRCGSIANR